MTSFLQKKFFPITQKLPTHSCILSFNDTNLWTSHLVSFQILLSNKTSDCSLLRVCCLFYIYHSEPSSKRCQDQMRWELWSTIYEKAFFAVCTTQWVSLEVRITIQVLNCISWCETSAFWVLFPWWLISKTSYYIEPQD